MKRMKLAVAVLAIVGMAGVGAAFASANGEVVMTVTVTVGTGVEVTGDPLAFGNVAPSAEKVTTTGAQVKNSGSTTQTYSLKITGKPATWTATEDATAVAYNKFKLHALFMTGTAAPAAGDFTATNTTEDLVKYNTETAASGDTVYSRTGEGYNGDNCTMGAIRQLWFMFTAPSGTELTTQQWITVTVTAAQG